MSQQNFQGSQGPSQPQSNKQSGKLLFNSQIVEEFFNKVILIPGYCFEARMWGARMDFKTGRIVKSKKEHAVAGWFSKGTELAFELTRVIGNVSVYLCPNPLRTEDRPKQAKDRFSFLKAGQYACDDKIAFVRWL